jgi:hypothetical protein
MPLKLQNQYHLRATSRGRQAIPDIVNVETDIVIQGFHPTKMVKLDSPNGKHFLVEDF